MKGRRHFGHIKKPCNLIFTRHGKNRIKEKNLKTEE